MHISVEGGEEHLVVAMDLPGISTNRRRDVTLVGHDVGGQIVYAYLHAYPDDLRAAVIMNVAVPGVEPWSEVIRNPYIWHFGFHAVPNLPELLVQGHQAEYFGYFYDTIAARPGAVHPRARQIYVEAYARPEALRTGFEWYRALCSIFAAERNRGSSWSAM
jgi:pimeloyl-ACP methyl ester carboxylesterase